jgi:general secretion pathway protein A
VGQLPFSTQPALLAHEQYFGFARLPFELSPNPAFLFRSATHAAATEQLTQALHRREGFLVLTGDIGTGKTTLCRALLTQLGPTSLTSLILNPFVSVEDLMREVLLDFGVVSRDAVRTGQLGAASTHDLRSTLDDFLQSIVPLGGTAILIIDEAQHLSKAVLEQIRLLSNLEVADTKLLQILLVGQLNLLETLGHADMRQFAQRISLRATLSALTKDESDSYIRHRIIVAAPAHEVVFLENALHAVFAISEGIPRVINLLCDRALAFAAQDSVTSVTGGHVRQAAQVLELPLPILSSRESLAPSRERANLSRQLFAAEEPRQSPRWLVGGVMVVAAAITLAATLWLKPPAEWVESGPVPALPAAPAPRVTAAFVAIMERPEDFVMPQPPRPLAAEPGREPVF